MKNWSDYLKNLDVFSQRLQSALQKLQIEESVTSLEIDHACIRPSSDEKAKELLHDLTEYGEVISTAIVNGRPIHIIELNEPLTILGKSVHGLEVPHPKPNNAYPEDWEHIELVMPIGTENTTEGIEKAFFTTFPNLEKAVLVEKYAFEIHEPVSETDQIPNPTIALKVDGVGLKFHAYPIQKVVGYVT